MLKTVERGHDDAVCTVQRQRPCTQPLTSPLTSHADLHASSQMGPDRITPSHAPEFFLLTSSIPNHPDEAALPQRHFFEIR